MISCNKYIDVVHDGAECLLSRITLCSRWGSNLQWSIANKFSSWIFVLHCNAWSNYLSVLSHYLKSFINIWLDDYGHSSYKKKSKCSLYIAFWTYGKFKINTVLCTLVQLLHNILKCNYFGMTIVRFFFKINSIPDEEIFSETYVGCTASYFF